jgi:hypothetical protein
MAAGSRLAQSGGFLTVLLFPRINPCLAGVQWFMVPRWADAVAAEARSEQAQAMLARVSPEVVAATEWFIRENQEALKELG